MTKQGNKPGGPMQAVGIGRLNSILRRRSAESAATALKIQAERAGETGPHAGVVGHMDTVELLVEQVRRRAKPISTVPC